MSEQGLQVGQLALIPELASIPGLLVDGAHVHLRKGFGEQVAAELAGSLSWGVLTGEAEGTVQAEGGLRQKGSLGRSLHSPV